jgi:hypothetical protein
VIRLVLVVLLAASVALGAPKKKVAPAKPKPVANIATEVAIKKTLDGAEGQVGACVLDNAGSAPFTLVVKAKLNINSAGQLLGSTVTLAPEGASAEKTRKCIEGVLQVLTWPKSTAPLVNAEREWSFSTESH